MNAVQFLLILRARYRVALLVLLATAVAALVGSHLVAKQYTAETNVMVDIRSPDPVAAVLLPAAMNPGNLGTQVEILKSDRVARKVVRILRLDENQNLKARWMEATEGKGKLDDWIAGRLQRGLTVTASRESNLMTIAYRGADPVFVAAVANAYAEAFIEASIEVKVEPARQYARWFGDQAKVLRENVEKAQARLSDYQRDKGIVVTEETLDYELAKLNDLSSRLTAVQAESRDSQSKQRAASGGPDALPEVIQSSVVQGLRSNIAQMEAKLKEAAGNLGTRHPQYQRMESELAELKNRLVVETRVVMSGFSSSGVASKAREVEIRGAIEAQKRKLLDLKNERDQIAVLVREVDTAKRAYEAVTNRFNQTSLESQATQTNVTVLSPAREPLEPSFPKPLFNTLLMAIAAGIVLGVGAALGLEMLDRRVRSSSDLAEMMDFPVLGVIEHTRRPGRVGFLRRRSAVLALR